MCVSLEAPLKTGDLVIFPYFYDIDQLKIISGKKTGECFMGKEYSKTDLRAPIHIEDSYLQGPIGDELGIDSYPFVVFILFIGVFILFNSIINPIIFKLIGPS